jgi:hypothetical protein
MDIEIERTAALKDLQDKIDKINSQLEFSIIEKACFIVEVGFLTVSADENNAVILQNVSFPTQFSEESVNKIAQMKFRNSNNELVTPKIYAKNEWYLTRKKEILETIQLLKNSQITN